VTNNEKIAALTSDAIRALGENSSKEIMAAVEAAENTVRILRKEAEQLIDETMTRTEALAEKVNSFINACQTSAEDFRERRERVVAEPVIAGSRHRGELPVLISDRDLRGK
jgi:hypothetical protein